jgi:anti-sigma factor RsiW
MNPTPTEHELQAYVDDRLEAQRRAEVESWLTEHPERAVEVEAWRQDARRLRAAYGASPLAHAPALDPTRIRAELKHRRHARLGIAAGILLSLSVGGAVGWQARGSISVAQGAPMSDALAAHRLFAEHGDFRPDMSAASTSDLQQWMSANFERSIPLPDLAPAGFHPTGGRMLVTDQGAAAIVVYQDAQNNAVSFYIRPPGPHARMLPNGQRVDGELTARYWSAGQYNYAVVLPNDLPTADVVARKLRI